MEINKEQYDVILSALADKIKAQERTICLQNWQIADLEKALAEAKSNPNTTGEEHPETLEIR